jgi:hypothetical protein
MTDTAEREVPSGPCPDCQHSLVIHDPKGCLVSTCDCDRPGSHE